MGMTFKKNISLTYDADAWALFDGPGREEAAEDINRKIENALNSGLDHRSANRVIWDALQDWKHLGACDSEGIRLADKIVLKFFDIED
jgi:hypothetical protein